MMPHPTHRDSSIVSDTYEVGRQGGRRDSLESSDLFGSDKENAKRQTTRSSLGKRKSASVAMSSPAPSDSAANKRRRLEEKGKGRASSAAPRKESGQRKARFVYDPEQDEASKRHTIKRLRELNAELNDSRAEYLQRDSTGLQDTIREADGLIGDVKQTSTATIDSRLLVTVGDIATKKVNTLTLGDSSTAIDVDDFLSQCISFMKAENSAPTQSIQQRRQNQRNNGNGNDDDEDEEEEQELDLDWARFGRGLCFPASKRPCLSSFLLGPLSVQKKVRAPTQRRATQRAAPDPALLARPTELDQEALSRKDNYSLTLVCGEIASLLHRTAEQGMEDVQQGVEEIQERDGRDATDTEVEALMRKHHVRPNGGVPMFDFCVNPKSFGQTVENFFYISFLVKEGRVGLDHDENELPTLSMANEKTAEERRESESVRNQAVFALSFDIWQDIVDSFGIEKSVIPHREAEAYEEDDGVLRDVLLSRHPREADVEGDELYTA